MRLCGLLLFSLFAISNGNQEYVPGTPGAAWTLEEMLVVKAKLFAIFGHMGGIRTGDGKGWQHLFSERKALRLGFHDCLKYKDGSGGCDGCLNWEGMEDLVFDKSKPYGNPTALETNNNGLAHTAIVLERIYTEPGYPNSLNVLAPPLNVSLKASGKSRADLWAFAAIAGLEYTIETNNMVCDGTYQNNPLPQCNYMAGKPGCRVELPQAIKFRTGRKDCTDFGDEGYIATKEESHPHLHGSGQMTVDFFAKDFGFNGRETVAIMGSHTVGRFHTIFSLLPYVWTTRGTQSFNNHYYKNIVKMPQPNFEDKLCTAETLADGSLGAVKYLAFTERQTQSGGPVMWVNFKHRCPNCNSNLYKDTACCTQAPEGLQCKPDEESDFSGLGFGRCERFNTNLGQDEIALNCEVGLYLDFKVSDTGIPYGCSGLEAFNNTVWSNEQGSCSSCWSRVPKVENPDPMKNNQWEFDEVSCPLNKLQEPLGSTPLHEVFEEYAEDQQAWVNDYVPTFEKMISNGYSDTDLKDAPDQWTDVVCPRPGIEWNPYNYHSCYQSSEISDEKSFYLINKRFGLAIQGDDQGVAKLTTLDYDNPRQRWVHTTGQDLINMGTNLPLIITNGAGHTYGRAWKFGDDNTIIETVKGNGEKALLPFRWWETKDEYDLTYFQVQEGYKDAFQFDKIMFNDVGNEAKYRIVSQWDQRVVEMVEDKLRMYSMDENNANQLWFKTPLGSGFQLINVGKNLPLVLNHPEVSVWVYNADQQSLKDANGSEKYLRRGKKKIDGAGVGLSQGFGGDRSRFVLQLVEE